MATNEALSLSFGPLDSDDVTELLAVFEKARLDEIVIGPELAGEYRVGDPGTIAAVVVVSTAAIGALTTFLLKRRRRGSIEYSLRVDFADGTSVRRSLKLNASDSSPPDPELVQRLAELTRVDAREVSDLVG
jgi:hypothetical protein